MLVHFGPLERDMFPEQFWGAVSGIIWVTDTQAQLLH